MSDYGTFVMDRGWFEHPAFAAEPFTEREAWAWMIAAAARGSRVRRVGSVQVPLARGQLAYSVRFMGRRFQWRPAKVQRFLRRLAAECMIDLVTESGVTCVAIKNYDKYQPAPPLSGVSSVTGADGVTDTAVSQQHSAASPCDSKVLPSARAGPESANESAAIQIQENKTTPSESKDGGDSSARAREALISEEAYRLANDVMQILGIDPDFVPPGWCGAPHWFHFGLASGWRPDLVRIAAARVRARRHYEPPFSFRYLCKPIQREHELAAIAPLPLPPVPLAQPEPPHATAQPDWRGRRDAQHAAFNDFRAGRQAAERAGDESDGSVVRMVPHARRG